MKKIFLLTACLTVVFLCFAQQKTKKEKDKFYMLDENFKGTIQEKAKYFIRVKRNDSCWQFDTYHIDGPLVSSEQYKDEEGNVLHGQSVYFNSNGTRDSIANFYNGFPEGPFYYFNDTGRIYIQKYYKKGILISTTDRIKQDSLDEEKRKLKKDTSHYEEKESSFAGGDKGWAKYLEKNLAYPTRAQNMAKQGQVVVQFIVDTVGHISLIEIIKSVEFSLDDETIRIIQESPAWMPAFQNGRKVKSYKKQPLTFRL
jgi:protein TonB